MGGDANVKLCVQHFYPRGSAPPRWEICFKECDRSSGHRVIPHPLPEVNFLMVEIPTLKPYMYSLFSYLFIKQDQMIMTCNSAVASLMLSRFL